MNTVSIEAATEEDVYMSMFVKDPGYLGHAAEKSGTMRTGWWDPNYRLTQLGRSSGLKTNVSSDFLASIDSVIASGERVAALGTAGGFNYYDDGHV